MLKDDVGRILAEIAVLLQLKGENQFKIRAYEHAARAIERVDDDLALLVKEQRLHDIKGIGKTLAAQIAELVQTGKLAYYEELRQAIPDGLFDLLKIPGLGPKKVKLLYDNLGVAGIGELEYACIENRLLELPGFGAKTQQKILQGIEFIKQYQGQYLFADIYSDAEQILGLLRKHPAVRRAALCGSIRRRKEIIKDIDLLAGSEEGVAVADYFAALPGVKNVTGKGDTKVSVTLDTGINVDLRIVSDHQFPYALHHFTGSKEHNTAMRQRARDLGYKINEYGLFKGDTFIPVPDEAAFFQALGLSFIPPELREDRGEIAAAERGEIPQLIDVPDIKGLFHIHTVYSDGSATLAEMAEAARIRGYQYIGIADHSRSATYARGLREEVLRRQMAEIDRLNEQWTDFRIFKGIESDILSDGSLDYADEILGLFDFIIASVHSHFRMTEQDMTRRLARAMENPHVTMLGHPTGRLLLAREGYPVNMAEVLETAARTQTFIEINASPYRLDLDWRWCKTAQASGVMLSINPDAHGIAELDNVVFGLNVARKGWLTAADVVNTRPLSEVEQLLNKKRRAQS